MRQYRYVIAASDGTSYDFARHEQFEDLTYDLPELLADVLAGRIDPGPVFDRTVSLDDVAQGYQAMDERTALKVIVKP